MDVGKINKDEGDEFNDVIARKIDSYYLGALFSWSLNSTFFGH